MDRQWLANRVISGGWGDDFTCADGLRTDMACANALSEYPTRVLGLVRTHLRSGPRGRERLARMLTGKMPDLEILTDAARRFEKPPFPGRR
jgi:hypothetical protein